MTNKPFHEALSDGFQHLTTITDPERLRRLRDQGILVDSEGVYEFTFGEHKEYTLAIEPIASGYYVSIYKDKIRLTEPLPIKPL